MEKLNDLFLNMVCNPSFKVADFMTLGINAENTSLKDKDSYKSSPTVLKAFTDEKTGKFDNKLFDLAYTNAATYYNEMANDTLNNQLKDSLVSYHRFNIFAPVEQRSNGPLFQRVKVQNPDQVTMGIVRLGETGKRTKSQDELAQANKTLLNPTEVYGKDGKVDWSKAKWGNSPNDSFFEHFFDTLVMALWDSDGEHIDPVTGETVKHSKGELKTNDQGTYYYEKLDGRDVYGRRVLNKMNVLTTDGSAWNKYDFFDSDDIELKSVIGNVAKNAALVGSMFIPYVGPVIAGISMGVNSLDLVAKLGKMIGGSDNSTLSALEGWSKSMNRQMAKSEYAQQHTWSFENILDSVCDLTALLREQRAIFLLMPGLFTGKGYQYIDWKKGILDTEKAAKGLQSKASAEELMGKLLRGDANNLTRELLGLAIQAKNQFQSQTILNKYLKDYNKIGEVLSKTYMAGLISSTLYEEAKQEGLSDHEAALLTLGRFGAEMALLNTPIGDALLPELRGARLQNKKMINALLPAEKKAFDIIKKGKLKQVASKADKVTWAKKLVNLGSKLADKGASVALKEQGKLLETFLASGANGFEVGLVNDIEEFLNDIAKQSYNWVAGEDKLKPWENNLDRYGMGMVSGLVGGTLTSGFSNYQNARIKITSENALLQLVYKIRNNEMKDVYKTLDSMTIGNKYLSTQIDPETGLYKPGTKDDNLDVRAKQFFRTQVNMLELILQARGAKSDNAFLDANTLGDLKFSALSRSKTSGRFLQEYNNIQSKIILKLAEINELDVQAKDTNKDGVKSDREERNSNVPENSNLSKAKSELKELEKLMLELQEGKRADEFIGDALFEMQANLSGLFTTPLFPMFAEQKSGKKFSQLANEEKEAYRVEFQKWIPNLADNIHLMASIYKTMAENASDLIKLHGDAYKNQDKIVKDINKISAQVYDLLSRVKDDDFNVAVNEFNKGIDFARELLLKLNPELYNKINEDFKNQIEALPKDDIKGRQSIAYLKTLELYGLITDNIANYIQPFIKQGFIGTETKSHISKLKKFVDTYLHKLISILDLIDAENMSFSDLISGEESSERKAISLKLSDLTNLFNQINNLPSTPLELNLNQFASAIGADYQSMGELYLKIRDIFNLYANDSSKFNLDEETQKELDAAIQLNKMYKAAILGARTDSANVDDIFGYNVTLNEVSKKLGKETNYAEIDKEFADLLIVDIDANLKRLEFYKDLLAINKGQVVNKQLRVGVNTSALVYKKLNAIFANPNLTGWDFSKLKDALSKLSLHKAVVDTGRISLTLDERSEFELERILMGDAIYDFFLDNGVLDSPEKLAEFINPEFFDFTYSSQDTLTENLQSVDDYAVMAYLASRAAVKESDFYTMYREVIDPNGKLIPLYTQELATYNSYAMVVNGDVFTNFLKAMKIGIKKWWKDLTFEKRKEVLEKRYPGNSLVEKIANEFNDKDLNDRILPFIHSIKYSNFVLNDGTPGSGKTNAVFLNIVKLLAKYNPEVLSNVAVVHGASAKSANEILENIKKEQNGLKGTSYEKLDFLKFVIPGYNSPIYVNNRTELKANSIKFNDDGEVVHNFTINKSSSDLPSIIFLDEIGRFNELELQAIDEYARRNGITVISAGDFDLETLDTRVDSIKFSKDVSTEFILNPERHEFFGVPKLGISMRSDNSLKGDNNNYFQYWMNHDVTLYLKLKYYEDETGLYGDKIYKDGELEETINKVKLDIRELAKTLHTRKDKDGKTIKSKITFLYTSANSSIYKAISQDSELSALVDAIPAGSAQGQEGQYYILDASSIKDNTLENRKKIYTAMSRALQGSILILDTSFNIDSELSKLKIDLVIPEEMKKKYVAERINNLSKVEGTPVKYKPRTKELNIINRTTNSSTPGPTANGEENNGDNTPPDNTPPPTPPSTPSSTPPSAPSGGGEALEPARGEAPSPTDTDTLVSNESSSETDTEPPVTTPAEYAQPGEIEIIDLTDLQNELLNELQEDNLLNKTPEPEPTPQPIQPIEPKGGDSIEVEQHTPQSEPQEFIYEVPKGTEDEFIDTVATETDTEANIINMNGRPELDSDSKANTDCIFDWIMGYTHNTFELGCQYDLKTKKPIFDNRSKYRYDSINGLKRLEEIKGIDGSERTIDDYEKQIAQLRSAIICGESKEEILESLERIIGFKVDIDFALKFNPVHSKNSKSLNPEGYFTEKNPEFDSSILEKSRHNHAYEEDSDKINPHKIVALIENKLYGTIIELPIMVLSSPLTLAQSKNNGEYVFKELNAIVEKGKENDLPIHEIANMLLEESLKHPEYKFMTNLLKIFKVTSGGLVRMLDKTWFPSKFENLGSWFVSEAGEKQLEEGLKYSAKFEEISKYAEDPQCNVTPIMKMSYGYVEYGDETVKVANAGHPFVLISHDKTLVETSLIIEQFVKLNSPDFKGIPKVELYYVKMPTATIEEYFGNTEDILFTKERSGLPKIGNDFTPFKLWDILLKNEWFKNTAAMRIPNDIQFIADCIDHINKEFTFKDDNGKTVYDTQRVMNYLLETIVPMKISKTGEVLQKVLLLTFLKRMLNTIVYNKTGNGIVGDTNSSPNRYNTNLPPSQRNEFDLIVLLHIREALGKLQLYHWPSMDKSAVSDSPFILIKQSYNDSGKPTYNVDGKPCYITGKIDPPLFKVKLDNFIDYVASVCNMTDSYGNLMVNYSLYLNHGLNLFYKHPEPTSEITKPSDSYNQLVGLLNTIRQYIPNYQISDSFDKITFSKELLLNELDNVINTINSSTDLKVMAFRVFDKLMISDENSIFAKASQIRLSIDGKNPLTSISPNSVGEWHGVLDVQTNEGIESYNFDYKDGEVVLQPRDEQLNIPLNQEFTINPITYELARINLENGLKTLGMTNIPALNKVVSAKSFEEFIDAMNKLKPLVKRLEERGLFDKINNLGYDVNWIKDTKVEQKTDLCSRQITIKFK